MPTTTTYSYNRLPPGDLPDQYLDVAPELVVEVRSPGDRWPRMLAKIAEYLDAGVSTVVVLDDQHRSAHVFGDDGTHQVLGPDDELELPDLLAKFKVAVRRFFE
ncbi:MAG: Uma2 family endonuclease [Isosphaeraceae bacterium]